jgi:hypothetical protein
VKLFSSTRKRRVVLAAGLIVLALFLLRPGASRIKSRLVSSISAAVGRPVEVGAVRLRLLPRPGFEMDNLVVYDEPAFGAEPMLRATEVTADLRLTSLLRGRLEIARLELTEPSLNLVHSMDTGLWNLETLVERSAHIPLAPTGKTKLEPRPRFPYIEATSGRINFKSGAEKKPYSLTNADFSLWQESENTWGVRLRAQPFRTDFNLNDTGILQMAGTWQRSATLRETPVQVQIEWKQAQLGQVSKFFTGWDRGWRGGVQVDAVLKGTPAKLQVASDTRIDDFRRYDITSGTALQLAAHCDAQYSSVDHAFHEVNCQAPVGTGSIRLKGELGLPGSRRYAVTVAAEDVPASAAVNLARRIKKNLPEDLTAEGWLRGEFAMESAGLEAKDVNGPPFVKGHGEIQDLHLSSPAGKAEIGPETIPFAMVSDATDGAAGKRKRAADQAMRTPEEPALAFGPIEFGNGHAKARGRITRKGYEIALAGETEIAQTLRLARMVGVPALPASPEGVAQVDLRIAGAWTGPGSGPATGFAGPEVLGTARLKNVRVALHGTGGPVEINAADMEFSADKVSVTKLSAKAAGTTWAGSMEMPRGCVTPSTCSVHFSLNAGQLVLAQWSDWVDPTPKGRPWYRALGASSPSTSLLAALRAEGRLTADRLQVEKIAATHVSAHVSLDTGKVEIADLNGDLLGGKHSGHWQADFSAQPPTCGGSGNVTKLSLASLAETMKDNWIAGTANGSYEVKGTCQAGFWDSAEGSLKVQAKDGTLLHLVVGEGAGPFKWTKLDGQLRLRAGGFEIEEAKVDSPEGRYTLKGTASFERKLDLKLSRAASAGETVYTISGTLADPQTTPVRGAEQAKLKRQ